MAEYEYRLVNPVPLVMNPSYSVTLDDYFDFFETYVDINKGDILSLIPYSARLKRENSQDYFIINAESEELADSSMNIFNDNFRKLILNNKKVKKDIFGVPLEKLAKLNYVKNRHNTNFPVNAFRGEGENKSGFFE